MKEIELIKITDNVYRNYCNYIKNNKDTDRLTAQKKITRNWILGTFRNETDEFEFRNYGNCFLRLDKRTNTIVGLFNDRSCYMEFNVDESLKKHVEKQIGLIKDEVEVIECNKDIEKESLFEKIHNKIFGVFALNKINN